MKQKIKDLYDRVCKYIKKIDIKKIIKNNGFFFIVVGTILINTYLLRAFTVGNFFDLKPLFGDLSVALMLCSLGFLMKEKNQFPYFLTFSIIVTALCVIHSMYYTFYTSFASISLIKTAFQIGDVADAVVFNVLQIKDFSYIWQPIFLIYIYNKKYKKNIKETLVKNQKKFSISFASAIVIFAIFFATLTPLEISRLVNQWNREFLLTKLGLFVYQTNDIVKSLEPKINNMFGYDKAILNVSNYYSEEKEQHTNKYTGILKDKNLILIHAESIQTNVIGLKFNDEEVAPNLTRLSKEGMFFNNFYSQVSVGTSSDTEYTFSTGLLPVNTGTVSISYWNRDFDTIQKNLKNEGYYVFSMHGNNGSFWNRNNLHKSLGFDKFYHKTSYEIDEKIGLGLSDMSFLRQSADKIEKISKTNDKFYGNLITLSNHSPFDRVEDYGEFDVNIKIEIENEDGELEEVVRDYMEGTTLGNYFKSVHYADKALGEFFNLLDEKDLLENTVIVIYGDHDARLSKSNYRRLYNYDPYLDKVKTIEDEGYIDIDYYFYELNRKVPLIIWSKNDVFEKKVETVMGMYDVFPTLANMLGIKAKYALGNDVLNSNDNLVVFPNGNWLTNNVYYNSQKQEYKVLKEQVITQQFLDEKTEKAETIISISNDFVIYDYLKHLKERENE